MSTINLTVTAVTITVGGGNILNLNIFDNEDSSQPLTLLDSAGDPFDITGYDVNARFVNGDNTLVFDLANDFTISTNTLTWNFRLAMVEGKAGLYNYDLVVKSGAGAQTTITRGTAEIIDGATDFLPPPNANLIIF